MGLLHSIVQVLANVTVSLVLMEQNVTNVLMASSIFQRVKVSVYKIQTSTIVDAFLMSSFFITGCNCNLKGSRDISCDVSGKCKCKVGHEGSKCEKCSKGYYYKELLENLNPTCKGLYSCDAKSCHYSCCR